MLAPLPRSFYVIGVMAVCLIWGAGIIAHQRALLDAKPLVELATTDERTEDVRREPVTIKKRKETTKPDGTKVVEDTEKVIGAIESHSETRKTEDRKETPAAPRTRNRYAGVGVNPFDTRQWRGRVGLNVLSALDLGVASDVDVTKIVRDPLKIFERPMLEFTYRF